MPARPTAGEEKDQGQVDYAKPHCRTDDGRATSLRQEPSPQRDSRHASRHDEQLQLGRLESLPNPPKYDSSSKPLSGSEWFSAVFASVGSAASDECTQ
jgi:hypothetical protein